jgi:hypothetical protein
MLKFGIFSQGKSVSVAKISTGVMLYNGEEESSYRLIKSE